MRRLYHALALLVILPISSWAQRASADAPVLDQLVGAWEGRGQLFGAEAEFRMKWERVLGGQFVRLTFENEYLQAQAFYKSIDGGRLEGTWFDSRGLVLPLKSVAESNVLTTAWGTPETEEGRTVYRVVDENRVEVEDFVRKGDEWHQFGHATYERVTVHR